MNKILTLLLLTFFLSLYAQAQKLEKCKVKDNSNVPKYKIANWERNEMANPPTLLVSIGLEEKETGESDLLVLAKHLERKYCKEPRADFWIFKDLRAARRPFDDTGTPWGNTIRTSIMGYSFDRETKENYFNYNLEGGYGFVGYDKKTIFLD